MLSSGLNQAAETFFVEFDAAFASFDGSVVATRYFPPYLAVRADGTSETFPSGEAIAHYFQKILDEHHRRGCRSCRHRALDLIPVGSAAVFATVTWELLGHDESVVTTWRESYNLVRFGPKLRAVASIDHAE